MKNIGKRIAVLVLTLCALLNLSACGVLELLGNWNFVTQVRGNIDAIYLGKHDPVYLEIVGSTKEESEQNYLEGLEVEAAYFASYWGIIYTDYGESYDDLNESLKNDIVELYKEIYSHSKYEVQSAVRQTDDSYAVKVLVDPIDIMEQAYELYVNDEYAPLNEFWEKHADADFSTMSDEDYMTYTHEYGEIIVQMVRDQLPALGYKEQKSMVIQVVEEDGMYVINQDDWIVFDSYVIYYP